MKYCRLGDSKARVVNTKHLYACGVDRKDAAGVAVPQIYTQAQGKKLAAECEQNSGSGNIRGSPVKDKHHR